jgi:hypothetical protein
MAVTSVSTADAAVTAGKCTITAVAPVLSGTSLYGSATITCTVATLVVGTISVVELDYAPKATTITATSPEDAVMNTLNASYTAVVSQNVAAKATVTVCFPGGKPPTAPATKCGGSTIPCLNTEVGNEEFATRFISALPAATSDRTLPKDNAFAC